MPVKKKKIKAKPKPRPSLSIAEGLPESPSIVAQSPKDLIQMFYGGPGVGKTYFVNKLGKVLFISTDRGTRNIKAMRVEVSNWRDIELTLDALEKKGSQEYEYVCIDHIDDICLYARMMAAQILKIEHIADAEFGKGWDLMRTYLKNLARRIISLKVGLVMIAHEQQREFITRNMKVDRLEPGLPKAGKEVFIPICDVLGYCCMKEEIKKGKVKLKRLLTTHPHEEIYCKDRSRRKRTEDFEPLDADKYLSTFVS